MFKRFLKGIIITVIIFFIYSYIIPISVHAVDMNNGVQSVTASSEIKAPNDNLNKEEQNTNSGQAQGNVEQNNNTQSNASSGNTSSGNGTSTGGGNETEQTPNPDQAQGSGEQNNNTGNVGNNNSNTVSDDKNSNSNGGNDNQNTNNVNNNNAGSSNGNGTSSANGNNGNSGSQNKNPGSNKTAASQGGNNNTEQAKSKQADLKSLKVDAEGITPDFGKNVTDYYLIVDLSVQKVNVTAIPADQKAKVTISGNEDLVEGDNTIEINVMAEAGNKKSYYIHVTKTKNMEKANANLKSLEVKDYGLSPSFKANIYNYSLNLEKGIESLTILAEAEKEKAKVEIKGNENLGEGDNLIEVVVTAEDGTTVRKYKINTYVSVGNVEIKEESKLPAIILLIVLAIGVIVTGGLLIRKNKAH